MEAARAIVTQHQLRQGRFNCVVNTKELSTDLLLISAIVTVLTQDTIYIDILRNIVSE